MANQTATQTNAATTKPTTPTFEINFDAQEQVSRELQKLLVGEVYFLKVLGAIHEMQGDKGRRKNADGSAQKPMEIMNTFSYGDRKQYQTIVNQVLGNVLRESYPNHSYIGLTFRITPLEIKTGRGGNRYNPFDVVRGDVKGVQTPDHVPYVAPPVEAPAQTDADKVAAVDAAVASDAAAQTAQTADKVAPIDAAKTAPATTGKPAPAPAQAQRTGTRK